MAITFRQVMNAAKRKFPGTTDDFMLMQIQQVNQFIHSEFCIVKSTYDITLVADQREYTLPLYVGPIINAQYRRTSSSNSRMQPFNVAEKDNGDPSWRWESHGVPTRFGIEGHAIVFDPKPQTASSVSTGYPKVTIDYWHCATVSSADENIPDSGRTYNVYLYGLLKALAMTEALPKESVAQLPVFVAAYEESIVDLDRYYVRRNLHAPIALMSG